LPIVVHYLLRTLMTEIQVPLLSISILGIYLSLSSEKGILLLSYDNIYRKVVPLSNFKRLWFVFVRIWFSRRWVRGVKNEIWQFWVSCDMLSCCHV
jgi:hypothetical protein